MGTNPRNNQPLRVDTPVDVRRNQAIRRKLQTKPGDPLLQEIPFTGHSAEYQKTQTAQPSLLFQSEEGILETPGLVQRDFIYVL